MTKEDHDARQNTFDIQKPSDWLQKLEWELQHYGQRINRAESRYIGINIAITAYHAIDWIAWETEHKSRWAEAAKNLGIAFPDNVAMRGKIKLLQKYAVAQSVPMKALEQIALASKHRSIGNFDNNVKTILFVDENTGSGMTLVQQTIETDTTPPTHYATMMLNVHGLGSQALQWLWRFYDDCCIAIR